MREVRSISCGVLLALSLNVCASPVSELSPASNPAAYTAAQKQVFDATTEESARKQTEKELLTIVSKQQDREIRAFALRQLQVCGSEAAITPVAALLANEELAAQAARTLSAIGHRTGASIHVTAGAQLPSASPQAAAGIINLLIERKSADSATIKTLLGLAAKDGPNQNLALTAISVLAPPSGSDPLLASLSKSNGWIRAKRLQENLRFAAKLGESNKKLALEHLTKLESALTPAEGGAMLHALEVRTQITGQVTDEQLKVLQSANPKTRYGAARILAASADGSLSKRLTTRLATASENQSGILACLIERDLHAAAPMIIQSLGSTDPELRRLALTASSDLPPAKTVTPLIALLKSDNSDDQESAAILLTSLTAREVNQNLHALLRDDSASTAHKTALEILADRNDRTAGHLFIAALATTDKSVRRAASRGLREVASAANTQAIIDQLRKNDVAATEKRNLQKALAEIIRREPETSLPIIDGSLTTAPEAELETLIGAFGIAGTPQAVTKLTPFTTHAAASVRKATVKGLSLTTTFDAATTLLPVAQNEKDETIRILACRGIADLAASSMASPTIRKQTLAKAMAVCPASEKARLQQVHDAIPASQNVLAGATWQSTLKTVGKIQLDAVTDDNLEASSTWTGKGSYHAILTATMEKAVEIDTIHVQFPTSAQDDYLYTLLISRDGRSFIPVSDVTVPGTSRNPGGIIHRIPAQQVKAVRILHLKNRADGNENVRITELRAFPPNKAPQIRGAAELTAAK